MKRPTRVIARVVDQLEQALGVVEVAQLVLARLGIHDHRTELEDLERLAVAADPRLAEEDRSAGVEPDGDRRPRS